MADELATTGMSSLLMQAARAAAQEDGVLVDSQQPQSAASEALQQARNALALQVSMNNAVQQQQQQQQQHQQQQQMKINAATVAAAVAQAQGAASPSTSKKKGPPLRRGKWTPEEEAYAARLIHEFKAGLLPLTDGTTLRTFLSKLLNCDPMRISKKFVGSNCIGKQVFRRRTADLNRLTPEQIQQSRIELSDLERRFLERVAQTNRVKNNGCTGAGGAPTNVPQHAQSSLAASNTRSGINGLAVGSQKSAPMSPNDNNLGDNSGMQQPNDMNYRNLNVNNVTNPPWLQPPIGYRHGIGQAFAQSHLNSHTKARAAAAGRALLGSSMLSSIQQQQQQQQQQQSMNSASNKIQSLTTDQLASFVRSGGSAGLLALAELQRRSSNVQSTLQRHQQESVDNSGTNSLLAAAVQSSSASALQELVRNASAHHLASQLGNADSSMNSLMLRTGLSRDQLSQLARDRGIGSSNSFGNLMNQQKSFDAFMSLDFQSLQSIDNLANLIQAGGAGGLNLPISNMKNADFDAILSAASSRNNLNAANVNSPHVGSSDSDQDFSNAAQRLANVASSNRMSALLRNLSNNNVSSNNPVNGDTSNATLSNLLQSMQANSNQLNGRGNSSTASLFNHMGMDGNASGNNNTSQSAMNLARFLRPESSTGLSALRMQDGLNQRNSSSVDDFLSLIAAGDIPHQDANLLNVPLMQQQDAAAKLLAQQHLLAASQSFSNMQRNIVSDSTGSNSSRLDDSARLTSSASASAVAMAMAQMRAAMQNSSPGTNNKRNNDSISGDNEQQNESER